MDLQRISHYRVVRRLGLGGMGEVRSTIANWYYINGEFDRAIAECHKVMAAFPDFPPIRNVLAMCCFLKSDYQEALKQIDAKRLLQPQDPLFCIELRGYALARLGRNDEVEKFSTCFKLNNNKADRSTPPLALSTWACAITTKRLMPLKRTWFVTGCPTNSSVILF